MKSFKEVMQEVAQPLSQGEKNFKELHGSLTPSNVHLDPKVLGQEHVFKGSKEQVDFKHTPDTEYDKDLKSANEEYKPEGKDIDAHFKKQSKKMQDAINLHLRKGNSYWDSYRKAKVHVKEEVEETDEGWVALGPASKPGEKPKSPFNNLGNPNPGTKIYGDRPEIKASGRGNRSATDIKGMREETINEKHLTPAEMKKREEIAKAMERKSPGMDKSKKMAIATAQAKRVAEEIEQLDEISKKTAYAAYANRANDDYSKDYGEKLKGMITKKWGDKAGEDAEAHASAYHWGRGGKSTGTDRLSGIWNKSSDQMRTTKSGKINKQDTKAKGTEIKGRLGTHPKAKLPEETIREDFDYDYEGEMAKAELNAICDKAGVLAEMMSDEMQLEAWLQSKISNAKMMVDSVYDYLMYRDHHDEHEGDEMPSQSSSMASNYGSFLNRMGEEVELQEKVMASDYKVGAEKSQFGGYLPYVKHKTKGHTMYRGGTAYKSAEHAMGHAHAYLKGYSEAGETGSDRATRHYVEKNKEHLYKKDSK